MKTLLAILAVSSALVGTASAAAPINDICPVCDKTARLIFHVNTPKGRVIFATAECMDKFDKTPGKYTVKPKS